MNTADDLAAVLAVPARFGGAGGALLASLPAWRSKVLVGDLLSLLDAGPASPSQAKLAAALASLDPGLPLNLRLGPDGLAVHVAGRWLGLPSGLSQSLPQLEAETIKHLAQTGVGLADLRAEHRALAPAQGPDEGRDPVQSQARPSAGARTAIADDSVVVNLHAPQVASQLLSEAGSHAQGMAWPGQALELQVQRDRTPRSPYGNPEDLPHSWSVRLQLDLPRRGRVEARIRVVGHAVAVTVAAPDPSSWRAGLEELRASLSARGLEPVAIQALVTDASAATAGDTAHDQVAP